MMRFYIAIDDTDNLEATEDEGSGKSMGTGARARELAARLIEHAPARHIGITRHQLFVDDAIPYTSHNSSACIVLEGDLDPDDAIPLLVAMSAAHLVERSAEGSDAGLCVAEDSQVGPEIVDWGLRVETGSAHPARGLPARRPLQHPPLRAHRRTHRDHRSARGGRAPPQRRRRPLPRPPWPT